jgi:DNA-binding transcriptional LysR family regulator
MLTNINLRHLRAFLAVARRQSFTKAAAELRVAPSALTETIKQLEQDTGVRLFDRTTRRVELTALGARLAVEAEEIVQRFGRCMAEMRAYGGLAKGGVRAVSVPSLLSHLLIPCVRGLRETYPEIQVSLWQENARDVARRIQMGEADFGLGEEWEPLDALHYEPLLTDRFGLACRRDHPLAGRTSLALADLAGQDIITLTWHSGVREALETAPDLPPDLLRSGLETNNIVTLMMMVRQGLGCALMPELAARVEFHEALHFIPLRDLEMTRRLYLITRRHHSLSPAAAALAGNVVRRAAEQPVAVDRQGVRSQ